MITLNVYRTNQINRELQSAAELIKRQIEQRNKEKEKVMIMFKREVIHEDEMMAEMKKINVSLKSLDFELSEYEKQISDQTDKELSASRVAELSQAIKTFIDSGGNQLSLDEKRHILETLVDEVIIRFDCDEVQVTAIGALDELKRQQFLSSEHDIGSCSQPQNI